MEQRNIAAVHVWLVLWKATKAVDSYALRSIEALGLCHSDFAVLEALLHKGPLAVNVLGAKVLLTSGSITAAVDRLERRGYVERREDANDRRSRVVHLTDSGLALIRKLFAEHERDMERLISCLNRKERASLVSLLRKVGRQSESLLARTKGRSQ